jgi:hypothetical protein
MIILDEQLNDSDIMNDFTAWYSGKVITIKDLRPNGVIKDDAIPSLLLSQRQPTFITINYADFWKRIQPHVRYCVICLKLSQDRDHEASEIVCGLLRSRLLATKSGRMGKVVSWRDDGSVDFYV